MHGLGVDAGSTRVMSKQLPGFFQAGQFERSIHNFVHPGVGGSPGCATEGEGTGVSVLPWSLVP